MRNRVKGLAIIGALVLVVSGCSKSSDSAKSAVPDIAMATEVGDGEGTLNLVAWAGYVEDGSTDPAVDWVTPFEKATGCQVNVKTGNTSDEMVTLMKTGEYDGVSASGDATLRLIYGGDVAPANTDLIPNYATVTEFLKSQPWNSVDGQMYGVPHGWGANVLAYTAGTVTPPTSWGAVFDANSPYKGKVSAYDSPIYIADAALYLMAHNPDLGITDPYALDEEQLAAAVELLKQQKLIIGEYWSDYTKTMQSFEQGNTVISTSWQIIVNFINAGGKVKVDAVIPDEGATGWSDTWMISSQAAHPNCMYKWMDWIISPVANAQVSEWFGESPSQTLACEHTADKAHCDTFHAQDATYAAKVHYWTTPTTECLDGRGPICTDYAKWTQAWTEVKG